MASDDVVKVVLSGLVILLMTTASSVASSGRNTDINVGDGLNRQETPHCSCNPVTNIMPPKNDGKEALVLIDGRLASLENQMHGLEVHMKQKMAGIYAQMEHGLGVLYGQIENFRNLTSMSIKTNAASREGINKQNNRETAMKGTLDFLTPINITTARPPDCATLQKLGANASGVYRIYLDEADTQGTLVYCDLTTDGGGWTVFQRRQDGSVNFYRTWEDYKNGFGSLRGEFWLGNENIHRLTYNSGNRLRIDLEDWGGNKRYATYGYFYVWGKKDHYRLTVKDYIGDAGDSLTKLHNGMRFSTVDADHDAGSSHCAQDRTSAWWFEDCDHSNLNGVYIMASGDHAVSWDSFKGVGKSIKHVTMKVRPYGFTNRRS